MNIFLGIPRTVNEAIEQILSGWSTEERESFRKLSIADLFDLRNTLGADIRNTFSLWYGNDELLHDSEKFLTEHLEFYNQALWMKEESTQGKKRVANIEDSPIQVPPIGFNETVQEEEEEDIDDELLEDFLLPPVEESLLVKKVTEHTPMDPFIASQVIIFATWNHLQVHGPTL